MTMNIADYRPCPYPGCPGVIGPEQSGPTFFCPVCDNRAYELDDGKLVTDDQMTEIYDAMCGTT